MLDEFRTASWYHNARDQRAAIVAELERLERQRNGWEETALRHHKNEVFYRDIVQSVGALFPDCYVSDDGSVQDQPLALKVLECVKAALAQRDARIAELQKEAGR